MLIRRASTDDADAACLVLRRSIIELCRADHQDDGPTLDRWLANKTPDNVRRWITDPSNHLFVAEADTAILGVAAIRKSGNIILNYVAPDARFGGVSKALVQRLEATARALGIEACTLDSTATALRFYRSMGYVEVGPPAPGFGVSLRHSMRKLLSAPE